MRSIRWVALVGGLLFAGAGGPPGVTPHVNYSCEIPYDATFADSKDFNRQAEFDIYSWNAFIALNWPAETSTKGEAPCNLQNGVARDCGKPLPHGDYGPAVWETWKPDSAVFRGDASGAIAPAGWNCPLEPLPGCDSLQAKNAAKERLPVLRMIVKDGNSAHAFLQAGTFAPLIDQNGSFVRYEMRMNRDELEFIDAKKLWDSNNHTTAVDFQPVGSNEHKTMGPMEVKAAWKILTDKDNRERFHTRTVEVAWPNKDKKGKYLCRQYTMGLVGFHIAHKTASAPQWIWSTFEQVDNYKGPHPSFTDAACDAKKCPPNVPPKKPQGGWSGDPTVRETPSTQVVVTPGSAATVLRDSELINDEVRTHLAELGSVWQYYELVSTQWPSVPFINDKPAPVLEKPRLLDQGAGQRPTRLANTTMETYLMGPNDPDDPDVDRNTSSCMFCHFKTGKIGKPGKKVSSDFSLLLQQAYPAAAGSRITDERRAEMTRLFHLDTSKGGQPTKAIPPKK
ncbi:MAG TPA: hypothetical protein VII75_03625 [Thermoanaerobaculia bacterium]